MNHISPIKKYWVIISFIVYLVVQWTIFGITIANNTARIDSVEARVENINPVLLDIRERLVSIETTLIFLRNK